MFNYPHSIENGHGEVLTFERRVQTAKGEQLEGWNLVKPGAGPPMHCHHFQEEGFTVVQGRLGYQMLGGEPQFAEEGESAVFPPGVPHRFWNAGAVNLKCNAYLRPPDNIEYFLQQVFDAQKRGNGKRPAFFDAAYLVHRYRSEYTMHEIPMAVQRLIFPIVVMVGTLLGKYRKFAAAPEPRRR